MRKKKLSKIAAVSLAFTLCVGSLAGCGKKDDEKSGSDDLYSVMQDAKDLKAGSFEMTVGMEVPTDDEKLELVLKGVTTDESFDIEVSLNMDMDELTAEGVVTRLIYEDEHLYINLADAMDYMNSLEEVGELSDFGIEEEYLDVYVGDLYQQNDNTAAEEMSELMLEILEDAATETDKKEGPAKDGNLEFKDTDVVEFMGCFAQNLKDNADDFVEFTVESSSASYDYEPIFDYYEDIFNEYGMDVDELKAELEATEELEISDEEKESMIEEFETSCDELITACEDSENADAKGSKFFMEASLDGKKGSRTYECNVEFLAASEEEGEEARIYMNYVFEEGEEKVKVPEESLDVKALLEILEPFMGSQIDSGLTTEPDTDEPGLEESKLIQNEDGSYGLGCYWGDCDYTGRVDFTPPEGYVVDGAYSDIDIMMLDDPDGNFVSISVYDGDDYSEGMSYILTDESEEMPTGTISTPIGDMEYIIDNTELYCSIYGFVTIDPAHYMEIDYTIYSSNEPTEEKAIAALSSLVQGLKAAQ